MRSFNSIIKISLFSLVLMTSCEKGLLDTNSLTEYSEKDVWSDPSLTQLVINRLYKEFDFVFSEGMKCGLVDESNQTFAGLNFDYPTISPDYLPNRGNSFISWPNYYKSIRDCNMFFEKKDEINWPAGLIDGKTLEERMTGEITFIRAFLYSYLVNYYGGVPLVTKVYGLSDDFKVARNTYAECIKFITDECDKAADLLPVVQSGVNDGRATKGAALALKARMLLFAASDLYNTEVFPGYGHPEFLRYTDGNRESRWKAAKDAAKAVIDMNQYQLYKANPGPTDDVSQNIIELFTLKKTGEDIFVKYIGPLADTRGYGRYTTPNGYGGVSTITLIGELVDDYEMNDGSKFSWDNPVHAAEPYKNREPRFYANVLYEGAKLKPRPANAVGYDPVGVIQAGVWQKWENNAMVEVWGLDTRKGVFAPHNGGYTGYYSRKMLDISVNQAFDPQTVPWRYFRYAEVLLNYAEACIELGQDEEARTYINMVRTRAGQPPVTESGTALRDRYRHERRIEMSLEDHRFYDVRRWVIGPEVYHPIHGVNIVYKLQPDHTTATAPTITPFVVGDRKWVKASYYFPIPRTEMEKNDLLAQNPDYN
ncbi:MAG: RagB/SusD family nutrient uptake outer membrane protein [Chitinophagaceae bacterium]|nr:RagB/SusD family nutrient uptake outer membrane protein [Chitinophagaceae bacterium]